MDRDQNDINDDFKKENIEITGSSKVNADGDDVTGDAATPLVRDDVLENQTSDDELDSDKMDFEDPEKNYI